MATPPLVKEIPMAFVSYSWDSDAHKAWVAALSARLRVDGVDVMLDDWHTRLGDQLPHFMESAIRKNDFVLIVCTPQYKQKSEARVGGVGYEGNIITAELSLHSKERKFIPILRAGDWHEAAPNWLLGKKACDLRGDPYSEREYSTLLDTLHGVVPDPPPVGPQRSSVAIQNLDSVAVTQQSKYAELVNAAIRAHQAAKNRIIMLKDDSAAARIMLPQADKDVENFGNLVFELQQEMSLLSSEPVAKAASEITGWVLAIRMNSHAPEREPELDAAFQSLIKTAIPNFREAVRRELAARGGVAEKLSRNARGKSESAQTPGANSVTDGAARSTYSGPETSSTQKDYEMVDNRTMTEPELKARLEELRHDYDLSRAALIKGGYITYAAFASALATLGMGLYAFLQRGEGFLSGNHFIAIFLILAASLIIYFSFVFGRQAKLRAEISKTKKLLEVSSGESVRK